MKGRSLSQSHLNNFPIWEKIYLDSNIFEDNDFFKNIKGVHVKNQVYIFFSLDSFCSNN